MFKLPQNTVILLTLFGVGLAWLFVQFIYVERHDSVLLDAVIAGDVPAARQAFNDGATMSMEIRRHFTFLQVAALHTNVEIAKLLVEHGAAATLTVTNDDGDTALDIAMAQNHTGIVEYLQSLMTTNNATKEP